MSRASVSEFPFPAEVAFPGSPEWADMLARVGGKYVRLSRVAARMRNVRRGESSLLSEIENERGRIARELHAGAGQPLAGIKMNLELLDASIQTGQSVVPADIQEAIARIHQLTESALGQVRAVSHRLHPPDWQNLSMTDALRHLVRQSGVAERCQTTLHLDELPEEPDHSVRVVLYRCAQECISNVLRHSGATAFSLSLSWSASPEPQDPSGDPSALTSSGGVIHLTIHDNGRGIPPDAMARGGIGLLSIREHAESVGGIPTISSGLGGTTIQLTVPFRED